MGVAFFTASLPKSLDYLKTILSLKILLDKKRSGFPLYLFAKNKKDAVSIPNTDACYYKKQQVANKANKSANK